MKIAIASIADPDRNDGYAVFAIAATLWCYSHALVFGPVLILAVYGIWFVPFMLRPSMLRVAMGDFLLLSLPLVALISAFWSQHPDITLRFSLQMISTVFCAVIAAHMVTAPNLARGLVIGAFITVLMSIADGSTQGDTPDGPLRGFFGSKNQLGLVAALGIIGAVSLMTAFKLAWWRKLGFLVTIAACCLTLYLAQSMTSVVSIVAALLPLFAAAWLAARPADSRAIIVPWTLVAGGVFIILVLVFVPTAAIFEMMGKDPTLTGRTDIWEIGIEEIQKRPALGTGYQAFWVPGNLPAERIWDMFLITEKTGFHFHNAFIQVWVELGVVGLIALSYTVFGLLTRISLSLFAPQVPRRVLIYVPLTVFFLVRMSSEIDFYGQFGIGAILVYFMVIQTARSLTNFAPVGPKRLRRFGPFAPRGLGPAPLPPAAPGYPPPGAGYPPPVAPRAEVRPGSGLRRF